MAREGWRVHGRGRASGDGFAGIVNRRQAAQLAANLGLAGLVRRAHAVGLQVHVWTVDDADDMQELLDRGVDGLMTDRTDILARVLAERGLWPEQRGTAEERSDR